jgi:flagellar P-ring protein precursor FlgI
MFLKSALIMLAALSIGVGASQSARADISGLSLPLPSGSEVRIKDIATVDGVRENQLVGYGLVVGLNGTGDSLRNSPFTESSIEGMLERLGAGNLSDDQIRSRNTAAVIVTASLPAFARMGQTLDVVVSSIGDASSLRGGTLIVTTMTGADGEVYAVAQGTHRRGGICRSGPQRLDCGGRAHRGPHRERRHCRARDPLCL